MNASARRTKRSTYARLGAMAAGGLLLTVTGLPLGSGPAAADSTTPGSATPSSGLGGFSLEASAMPVQISLNDPSLPIPAKPSGELDLSYSQATVSTGLSHAVSSLVWPGAVLGDGLPTLGQFLNTVNIPLPVPVHLPNLPLPQYPIKSETTAPQGPFDATMTLAPGANQTAHSGDVSSAAATTMSGFDTAGLISVGGVTSTSTSTAASGRATAAATSAVSNLSLLAGMINVSSIKTDISAVSDGAKATVTGTTNMSGLTVAGMAFTADSTGLHLAGTNSNALSTLLGTVVGNANQALAALGINVSFYTPLDTSDGASASRSSTGLVITIDTAVLKAKIAGPFNALLAALPSQFVSQLGTFTSLAPTITMVIGSAYVSSAASPTFDSSLITPPSSTDGAISALGGSSTGLGSGYLPGSVGGVSGYVPGTPGTPARPGTSALAGQPRTTGARLIAVASAGLPVGLIILILALALLAAAAMRDMWTRLVMAPVVVTDCPLEEP